MAMTRCLVPAVELDAASAGSSPPFSPGDAMVFEWQSREGTTNN